MIYFWLPNIYDLFPNRTWIFRFIRLSCPYSLSIWNSMSLRACHLHFIDIHMVYFEVEIESPKLWNSWGLFWTILSLPAKSFLKNVIHILWVVYSADWTKFDSYWEIITSPPGNERSFTTFNMSVIYWIALRPCFEVFARWGKETQNFAQTSSNSALTILIIFPYQPMKTIAFFSTDYTKCSGSYKN